MTISHLVSNSIAVAILSGVIISSSCYAVVSTSTSKSTTIKKTSTWVISTKTAPIKTSIPTVISNPPVTPVVSISSQDTNAVAILRNYLSFRDQIFNYTLKIGDANGDCGIYMNTWNMYFLPYLENLISYANSQKADYVSYIASRDMSMIKTYLSIYKKWCTIWLKDVAITTPALSTLNKNQKSLYQTLLIEDFGYSALDMMPNITYGVECSIFKGENWKFFYKPRFENYRTIATSLGLDAELKYIQTYQKTLAGYSKYACGTELEF